MFPNIIYVQQNELNILENNKKQFQKLIQNNDKLRVVVVRRDD